jgi:Na+/proline symporter
MNLSLTPLDWIVLFVVMAGSLGYGMYMAFRKKSGQSSSGFFLGGRSINWRLAFCH